MLNSGEPKHMSWSPGVGSHTPGSTPKHSVHFHDPQLLKDGVLVTKVQCRIVSAKDILGRQKSPVRLVQLSPSSSPLHLSPDQVLPLQDEELPPQPLPLPFFLTSPHSEPGKPHNQDPLRKSGTSELLHHPGNARLALSIKKIKGKGLTRS